MNRITLDAAMIEKLLAPMQPVEVCDESGTVIGFFSPKMDASQFEDEGLGISDEEIERRLNSNERRYSTAEVLRSLEKK
jgi:hypothetical protein